MNISKFYIRGSISFALVLALTTVFSLRSFAVTEPVADALLVLQNSGTLTVEGQATINGNAVQTGATVMDGSLIATGPGSKATIDLGPLGRIILGADTTIFLNFSPGMVQVRTQCSRAEIEAISGQVNIKSPKLETLNAGKEETYNGSVEAMTTGGTDFEITCEDRKVAGGAYIGAGLWGLLSLIGVGAGIALGIVAGDEGAATTVIDPSPSADAP